MVSLVNMILKDTPLLVAFFGIYYKLQNFLFMPMNGLGQGSIPIIAYNYGASHNDRVKETYQLVIKIAFIMGFIGMLIFVLFPGQLLGMFSATQELIQIGTPALRIIAPTFILGGMTLVIGYIIASLGNGVVNMIATCIRQVIVLIPSMIVLQSCSMNIWISFIISELLAFIYAYLSLRHELKKKAI